MKLEAVLLGSRGKWVLRSLTLFGLAGLRQNIHKETSFPHVLISYVFLSATYMKLDSHKTYKETLFPHELIHHVFLGYLL